ncbi:MAG: putative transcriptional regulator [Psychrobacter glaciei]|jgi:putative transcriptional regulator
MAHYHPNHELLMQFAAGQLGNALGIMVACHLESCAECRQTSNQFEHLGGDILDSLDEVDISPDFISRTMAKLTEVALADSMSKLTETSTDSSKDTLKINSEFPKPLQRFLPASLDQLSWYGVSKNIKQFDLSFSDKKYTAKFYKIKAGKELPQHTHRGQEFTLVVDGAFSDEGGSYHKGDFILADTSIKHQPKAHADCDCICFAVTNAPLQFTGFWGKMLNPFMR